MRFLRLRRRSRWKRSRNQAKHILVAYLVVLLATVGGLWAWDPGKSEDEVSVFKYDGASATRANELDMLRGSSVRPAQSLLEKLVYILTGVVPSDPVSYMALTIPALRSISSQVAVSGEIGSAAPLPLLPVKQNSVLPVRDLSLNVLENAEDPLVLIYHTHAREAYAGKSLRNDDEGFSDNPDLGVLAVGEELVKSLKSMGVPAVQSRVVHDKEGRLGAYLKSESTIKSYLSQYPSLKILLDIHRDSQPRSETITKVSGKPAARVLVVIGRGDQAKLANPNWEQNYAFAKMFVDLLEQLYPAEDGNPPLSRGILPKPERYNQHLSPGALLLEIGGPENSVSEARYTAQLVSRAIYEVLRGLSR